MKFQLKIQHNQNLLLIDSFHVSKKIIKIDRYNELK